MKIVKHRPDFHFIFNFEYPTSNPDFKIFQEASNRIIGIAMKRQSSSYLKKMIEEAWDEIINKNIPEGGKITPEIANEFASRIARDFVDYYRKMTIKS